MLNAKALSALLSKNSDDHVCKRWFLMTRNGTLLAYTQPANIRDLRKQAAMATLSWHEHEQASTIDAVDPSDDSSSVGRSGTLRTLTVESDASNLIIGRIQSHILLVLEGGLPPRRAAVEVRITPEIVDGPPHTWQRRAGETLPGSSVSSAADSTTSSAAKTVLALQRQKFDAVAAAIAHDLDAIGFRMSESSVAKIL